MDSYSSCIGDGPGCDQHCAGISGYQEQQQRRRRQQQQDAYGSSRSPPVVDGALPLLLVTQVTLSSDQQSSVGEETEARVIDERGDTKL